MDVPDVVTDHLPTAVVTSLLIAPFDIYPGEIIVLAQLGIDLLVHVVALFVGFVVIEEGPTTASIDATLDIAGVWTIDTRIESRPRNSDEQSLGNGRRAGWRV